MKTLLLRSLMISKLTAHKALHSVKRLAFSDKARSALTEHYESAYSNDNYLIEKDYTDKILRKIIESFHFDDDATKVNLSSRSSRKKNRLVDLGCGLGHWGEMLGAVIEKSRHKDDFDRTILCVDNYLPMLEEAMKRKGVETLQADAVTFSQLPHQQYSHILLKECIHHVSIQDLPIFFRGITNQLLPGGKILIITRPAEPLLPFFVRLNEIWKTTQPPTDIFIDQMKSVGLKTSIENVDMKVYLPKEKWFSMIRNKFWSEFSMCSNEEIESGIKELDEKYYGEYFNFVDRLLFIKGSKDL